MAAAVHCKRRGQARKEGAGKSHQASVIICPLNNTFAAAAEGGGAEDNSSRVCRMGGVVVVVVVKNGMAMHK